MSVYGGGACYGQEATRTQEDKKWFIALPLRFTQLQDHPTMLSGIRIGRKLMPEVSAAVSVYHSFYLNSFKAEANLSGFPQQPRLYINGVGAEVEYTFLRKNNFATGIQFMAGWGFLKYDLKAHQFSSKQVNYLALEPALNVAYTMPSSAVVGLGIGYRPIISQKAITYRSDLSDGAIPVAKTFPNGLNILVSLTGFL